MIPSLVRSAGTHKYQAKIPAYIFSFFIPFGIMLLIFMTNCIFPFGDESFMHSDMYHQYVPFLAEMMRKLRAGESLLYSWNTGAGSNFLALFAYYMASPFNWLAVLFPEQYLIEFMSYMVVVKTGLAGLSFCWYLNHHFSNSEEIGFVSVPFSIFYALSGYMAAYNWNVMWLDCVVLFPLIALGLEQLVCNGKYRLYCISLTLCILTNYYISIMVCFFLVLYFIIQLVSVSTQFKEHTLSRLVGTIMRFSLFSLLAGGMAAALLVPVYYSLQLTEFTKFSFPNQLKFYFSIFDMLARHCINVATETGLDHWPNIYCGTAVLLLIPLYAANPSVPLREKAGKLGLLAFLLVSFSANMLNFIWHGFNYPNSLPCRQSFLYIFLLLTLACEAVLRLRSCSAKTIGLGFGISLCAVLLFEKFAEDTDAYAAESFILTAVLLCIYAVFLYHYHKAGSLLLLLLFLTAAGTETGINMYSTSCSVTSRSLYLENQEDYAALLERIKLQDTDFYRIEKLERKTKNDGTFTGYPTASLFSSTSNGNLAALYEQLGMQHSKVYYCYDGATPFSSALLSVRYIFSELPDEDPSLFTLIDQEDNIYLYRCSNTLPLGFVLPESMSEFSSAILMDHDNPLDGQNLMVTSLGISEPLFLPQSVSQEGNNILFSISDSGHYYAYVNNSDISTLKLHHSGESKTFTKVNKKYILDLGRYEAGESICLSSEDDSTLGISVYRLDNTVLESALRLLNSRPLSVASYDTTHISGSVHLDSPGELILTVPSEPGWTVLVDGIQTETGKFGGAFLSIPLSSGTHQIELSYLPQGFHTGIAISILSLMLFLIILFSSQHKHWNTRNNIRISKAAPEEI